MCDYVSCNRLKYHLMCDLKCFMYYTIVYLGTHTLCTVHSLFSWSIWCPCHGWRQDHEPPQDANMMWVSFLLFMANLFLILFNWLASFWLLLLIRLFFLFFTTTTIHNQFAWGSWHPVRCCFFIPLVWCGLFDLWFLAVLWIGQNIIDSYAW